MIFKIDFLDGHPPIEIEDRPIVHHPGMPDSGIPPYDTPDMHCGWGDRESDIKPYTAIRRQIKMRPPIVRADELAAVSPVELARVQSLVDAQWTETTTVAPACESYRVILQGIHDKHVAWERAALSHPQIVGQIRLQLARRRLVSLAEASAIIVKVAPDEDRIPEIIESLSDAQSIYLWSPDCVGHMRYDQPGTMSHQPLLVFVPLRQLSLPRFAPRAIVLRVAA